MSFTWRPQRPTPSLHLGAGEPVMLLHGFMMSHHCFDDVAAELAKDYEVFVPTMLGHWGGPRTKLGRFSIEAAADQLERQMDELGWQTCHVVGNSLGGWVGLELAARGRARSLIGVAPGGGWLRSSRAQWLAATRFIVAGWFALAGFILGEFAARNRLTQLVFLHAVSKNVHAVSRDQAANYIRATTHCKAYLGMILYGLKGGFLNWQLLQNPFTVVLCKHDRILPPKLYGTMFFTACTPVPERVDLKLGHVPMLEDPEQTTAAVARILRSHGAVPQNERASA